MLSDSLYVQTCNYGADVTVLHPSPHFDFLLLHLRFMFDFLFLVNWSWSCFWDRDRILPSHIKKKKLTQKWTFCHVIIYSLSCNVIYLTDKQTVCVMNNSLFTDSPCGLLTVENWISSILIKDWFGDLDQLIHFRSDKERFILELGIAMGELVFCYFWLTI